MAKDGAEKSVSSRNSDDNSPPTSDQQRVPPLRIVLNVSGNQKSSSGSSASSANNQHDQLKRDKPNEAPKSEPTLKTGGKVRIKLGTGKPANRNANNFNEIQERAASDESQKSRSTARDSSQDNPQSSKDDNSIVYSHLRRITRRSHRGAQTVHNEDDESISSMTSTDENQNSNSNNNSTAIGSAVNNGDSNGASQDCTQGSSAPTTTTNTGTTSTTAGSEAPRRKRRKGETTETQLTDYESTFNFQSYRISVQNSFELFKNIRKHVDKKLKTLSGVHPKAPHGFRDYMLTKGAYLLDGNRLGNGTNLFMNEDGGLNSAPMVGKYHVLRHQRVSYTVPNRAKVPLGLAVNSPLYNLFIEQEKERYRMRIQHIKEREKLTLAAEQEIVRVYNQAAMAAINQDEPFSACTMLKHQEIYNYLDSDGVAILASEDARLDQVKPSGEGVRTRRRQHEQITSPSRKSSNSTTNETSTTQSAMPKTSPPEQQPPATSKDEANSDTTDNKTGPKEETKKSHDQGRPEKTGDVRAADSERKSKSDDGAVTSEPNTTQSEGSVAKQPEKETKKDPIRSEDNGDQQKDDDSNNQESVSQSSVEPAAAIKIEIETTETTSKEKDISSETKPQADVDTSNEPSDPKDKLDSNKSSSSEAKQQELEATTASLSPAENPDKAVAMDVDETNRTPNDRVMTEDDVRAYNREVFLSQLQDIDDKWERIRTEMLARHRNEAESLYAVQKLEWEWKTKEIGACDVRMTPIIDETLVPKLNIFYQDY